MKNIFFRAMPGLFKRKDIETSNQQYFYSNKVIKSISRLESANSKLLENLEGLKNSTVQIGEKTEDLFKFTASIKETQAEDIERISEQVNVLNKNQIKEIKQVNGQLHDIQKKQQEKISNQLAIIEKKFEGLKAEQGLFKVNMVNETEILKVLIENLGEKIENLKEEQKEEINSLASEIATVKRDSEENNGIHLKNNRLNSDMLYKLREHYIDMEQKQMAEQKYMSKLLSELRKDITELHKIIKVAETIRL